MRVGIDEAGYQGMMGKWLLTRLRIPGTRLIRREDGGNAPLCDGEGMMLERDPIRFNRDDPAGG